jgi:calcium/calmodulin-dependent protein kinase I
LSIYRYASIDPDAPLKLADFGLAQILKPHELMHSACGTPGYVAPEVLRNESTGYGKEVDMWSIGVILYVILCGFPPFYDEDNARLFQAIQLGEYEYPSPYWDDVSAEAIGLIDKLLVLDPAHRLTAKQALQHTWLTNTSAGNALPHFNKNMRAFNARRRMRGALRVVQMANALKGFGGAAGLAAAVKKGEEAEAAAGSS